MSRSASSRSAARPAGAGFTLIEVIVALAILTVALAVVLQNFSIGMRGARLAERHTIAVLHAESKLAAVGVETPLEEGETSGVFDNGFGWRATIRPYLEAGQEEAPDSGAEAYEVAVTVSWDDAGGRGSVTLETLRLAAGR